MNSENLDSVNLCGLLRPSSYTPRRCITEAGEIEEYSVGEKKILMTAMGRNRGPGLRLPLFGLCLAWPLVRGTRSSSSLIFASVASNSKALCRPNSQRKAVIVDRNQQLRALVSFAVPTAGLLLRLERNCHLESCLPTLAALYRPAHCAAPGIKRRIFLLSFLKPPLAVAAEGCYRSRVAGWKQPVHLTLRYP